MMTNLFAKLSGFIFKNELTYRALMQVKCLRLGAHNCAYPVCPRCSVSMDREYQAFCDRCGQRLGWKQYDSAEIILPSLHR